MNLKIHRKIFILIVLTVGLFFAASINSDKVNATECCDFCNSEFNTCLNNCDITADRECEDECFNIWYECFAEPCYPWC